MPWVNRFFLSKKVLVNSDNTILVSTVGLFWHYSLITPAILLNILLLGHE